MILTKNAEALKNRIHSPDFSARNKKVSHSDFLLKELWQSLRSWESEFKFLKEEYQVLEKIAHLHSSIDGKSRKRLGRPFLRLKETVELQFPKHQKSLRAFHMALRTEGYGNPTSLSERLGEMRKLDKKLTTFRTAFNSLKLVFFRSLLRTTPVTFY